jgi:hypothetical protein
MCREWRTRKGRSWGHWIEKLGILNWLTYLSKMAYVLPLGKSQVCFLNEFLFMFNALRKLSLSPCRFSLRLSPNFTVLIPVPPCWLTPPPSFSLNSYHQNVGTRWTPTFPALATVHVECSGTPWTYVFGSKSILFFWLPKFPGIT